MTLLQKLLIKLKIITIEETQKTYVWVYKKFLGDDFDKYKPHPEFTIVEWCKTSKHGPRFTVKKKCYTRIKKKWYHTFLYHDFKKYVPFFKNNYELFISKYEEIDEEGNGCPAIFYQDADEALQIDYQGKTPLPKYDTASEAFTKVYELKEKLTGDKFLTRWHYFM